MRLHLLDLNGRSVLVDGKRVWANTKSQRPSYLDLIHACKRAFKRVNKRAETRLEGAYFVPTGLAGQGSSVNRHTPRFTVHPDSYAAPIRLDGCIWNAPQFLAFLKRTSIGYSLETDPDPKTDNISRLILHNSWNGFNPVGQTVPVSADRSEVEFVLRKCVHNRV